MKKKAFAVLMTILFAVMLISCGEKDARKENDARIKNVILLIPDGGGYGNFDLANDVKEAGGFTNPDFDNKTVTDEGPMFMKDYLAGSATTLNVSGEITDSAASGTAIATGYKTTNGHIGIDKDMEPHASILEAAQSIGKATGIISTYEWMPAGMPMTHSRPLVNTLHLMQLFELQWNLQETEMTLS